MAALAMTGAMAEILQIPPMRLTRQIRAALATLATSVEGGLLDAPAPNGA